MDDRSDISRTARAWDARTLRAPHAQPDKAARVQAMFDAIAPTYERVNTIGSLGRDARWRRHAVAAADPRPGDMVLDIGCGTGDMMRAFVQAQPEVGRVIGVDFSAAMLRHAVVDVHGRPAAGVSATMWPPARSSLVRADALRLPLAEATVDIISCAFAVRNFADLPAGLAEMARVARPSARLVILEFATPENVIWRRLYQFYCDVVLPRVAAVISRDRSGAYRYLPRSIQTFEPVQAMVRRLEDAGFGDVTVRRMNVGGVVLYRGVRR